MKSFHDILLTEILDTKVSVKVTDRDIENGGWAAKFKIDKMDFEFNAIAEEDGWEISFSRLLDGKWSFDVLGDFDLKQTLAVFSGVKKAMELWVKDLKKSPTDWDLEFTFSAKKEEGSRAKLYDMFAKKIASKLKLTFNRSSGIIDNIPAIIYSFS